MKTAPAVILALVLSSGIYLGDLSYLIDPVGVIAACIVLIIIPFFTLSRQWSDIFVLFAVFSLGFLIGNRSNNALEAADRLPSGPVEIYGKVIKQQYHDDNRQVYVFKSERISTANIQERQISFKLRLITSANIILQPGTQIILTGQIQPYRDRRNPGGRDFRREFAREGIIGWIKTDKIDIINSTQTRPSVHDKIAGATRSVLPPRQAGLLTGMLLGDKSELPKDIKEDFRDSGLYHLLAVSGLHIGYLLVILSLVLNTLLRSIRLRRIVLLMGLWGYVLLTGANPPTVRAAIMITLIMASFFTRRIPRMWNIWGSAALLMLLFAPQQLFRPGFQLSFVAMAAILFVLDIINRQSSDGKVHSIQSLKFRKIVRNYISMPLLISLSIVVLTAPILIAHFGRFTPVSIVLNLVAIPLAGGIFGLAWVILLMHLILGMTILPLNSALELGLRGIEFIADLGARIPVDSLTGSVDFISAISLAAIFILVISSIGWKRRIIYLATGLALLMLIPLIQTPSHLRIECLDVGQGDATLLSFPGRSNLLIDCGDKAAAAFELIPSFKKRGINRINNLLITHFDADHAGGTIEIIESFTVDRILLSFTQPSSSLGRSIIEKAQQNNVPIRSRALGDTLGGYPGAKCQVLWPLDAQSGDENDESIVLKITYGEVDLLFTGDIGRREEQTLLAAGDYLNSEFLKVSHHGSRYSSSKNFLKHVAPKVAIVSAGERNRYGHPHQEVLENLRSLGVEVHRTDIDRAAVYASDGIDLWQVEWR